ncbi:MAG: HAMP domain-containing histidine kinase [Clostridiales bacterium]|nr:HAMP domain-containing histidine kinase [Clostridiales bacterium]
MAEKKRNINTRKTAQGNKATIVGLAVFLGFVLVMFAFLLISQFYSSAMNKTPVIDENGVYTLGGDLSSIDSCTYYCNDGWVFVPNATEDNVASGRLDLGSYKDYTYAENISIHSGDGGWYDYDWQYRWHNRSDDFCYVSNETDGESVISGVYLGHFECPNNLKYVYFSFKDINGYAKVYCNGSYSGTIGKASGVFLNNKAFSDYCLLAPENGELNITIVVYCYDKITNPGIVSSPIIENSMATDQRVALTASHLAVVIVIFVMSLIGGSFYFLGNERLRKVVIIFSINFTSIFLYYLTDYRFLALSSHVRVDLLFCLCLFVSLSAYSICSVLNDDSPGVKANRWLRYDRHLIYAGALVIFMIHLIRYYGFGLMTPHMVALVYSIVIMLIMVLKCLLFYSNKMSGPMMISLYYSFFIYLIDLSIIAGKSEFGGFPAYISVAVAAVIFAEIAFIIAFVKQQREIRRNSETLRRQIQEKTRYISEINKDLVETNKKLKEGEQARKNVLSNVSHDLRTPITAIRGYSELMLTSEGMDEDQKRTYLTNIVRRSEQMERIVSDIVELTRMESSDTEFMFTDLSVCEMLDELVTMYSLDLEGTGKHLSIDIPEDDLLIVKADPKKFSRVFENLISNSINYTHDEAEIVVKAWRTGKDLPVTEQKIHISVKDNGVGIPLDEQSRIFDRFYRAKNSGINIKGTGLGLAIVKLICDRHNAKITVTSDIGKGTEFEVILDATY